MTQTKRCHRVVGFTLIELLVGMMITSIILSAVATLAFAMSVGVRDADDTIRAQMQLRYATVRISELMRTCRLVCAAPGHDLVLWRADDNHNDRIDVNEIVYIEYDEGEHELKLLEFDLAQSPSVLETLGLPPTAPVLTTLGQTQIKTALVQRYQDVSQDGRPVVREPAILQECRNVVFTADQDPPHTRRLTISFDLTENNRTHHYEIDTTLRVSAQHLLSSDGSALVSDDD